MTVSCILFDFGDTLAKEDFLLAAPSTAPIGRRQFKKPSSPNQKNSSILGWRAVYRRSTSPKSPRKQRV
jgi:hypothetical protein